MEELLRITRMKGKKSTVIVCYEGKWLVGFFIWAIDFTPDKTLFCQLHTICICLSLQELFCRLAQRRAKFKLHVMSMQFQFIIMAVFLSCHGNSIQSSAEFI